MRTIAPECRARLERCGYHLDASRDYWLKNDTEKGALRIAVRDVERHGLPWIEAKLREFAAMPSLCLY